VWNSCDNARHRDHVGSVACQREGWNSAERVCTTQATHIEDVLDGDAKREHVRHGCTHWHGVIRILEKRARVADQRYGCRTARQQLLKRHIVEWRRSTSDEYNTVGYRTCTASVARRAQWQVHHALHVDQEHLQLAIIDTARPRPS
jgi:hypothetical protein